MDTRALNEIVGMSAGRERIPEKAADRANGSVTENSIKPGHSAFLSMRYAKNDITSRSIFLLTCRRQK